MKKHGLVLTVSAIAALAGCAPAEKATPLPSMTPISAGGLAGTEWKLVGFQSMDDAQDIIRPAAGRMFSIRFNVDRSANMVLDCNRGKGQWQSDNVNASGGTLTFGPIVTTRAKCPPSALGDKLISQFPYVRSYTLRDGRLFLALMADGGIFEFGPASAK